MFQGQREAGKSNAQCVRQIFGFRFRRIDDTIGFDCLEPLNQLASQRAGWFGVRNKSIYILTRRAKSDNVVNAFSAGAHCLRTIQDQRAMPLCDFHNGREILNDAGFIICQHTAHQKRSIIHARFQMRTNYNIKHSDSFAQADSSARRFHCSASMPLKKSQSISAVLPVMPMSRM